MSLAGVGPNGSGLLVPAGEFRANAGILDAERDGPGYSPSVSAHVSCA
jgi:hypothetical protein